MNIPEHITDITRGDFADIARATNPTPGIGITIEKKADTIQIGISELQFKRMIWTFLKNGGASATAAEVDAVPIIDLV